MNLKVAFWGNNLNQGYFFVEALNELGIEAKLFQIEYPLQQEYPAWWTNREINSRLIKMVKITQQDLKSSQPLLANPEIRALYDEIKQYHALMMMEFGPAVFSEFKGIKKIFIAAGWDIHVAPFLFRVCCTPKFILKNILVASSHILRGNLRKAVENFYNLGREIRGTFYYQTRQRRGIRQCAALLCVPNQRFLIDRLHLDYEKVHYLPYPMDEAVLSEIDQAQVHRINQKYAGFDTVFLHPARQLYLKLNGDIFLKDNDKLIHAYQRLVKITEKKVKLLLVRKGREQDIANTQRLIRELGIECDVEWLPEMPNKKLRAYYACNKVVVCDQYSPYLSYFGNIGREASYYGRLIITSFDMETNRLYYGDDLPPHVFPAHTENKIVLAMQKVMALSCDERENKSKMAIAWFNRTYHEDVAIRRYVDLIRQIVHEQ